MADCICAQLTIPFCPFELVRFRSLLYEGNVTANKANLVRDNNLSSDPRDQAKHGQKVGSVSEKYEYNS